MTKIMISKKLISKLSRIFNIISIVEDNQNINDCQGIKKGSVGIRALNKKSQVETFLKLND